MLGSLVAGFGGGSLLAYKAIQNRIDPLREAFRKQPEVQREVAYAREKLASMSTVDEMLDDPRLTTLATTAFGLEDKAFAKAFLRKVLVEGTDSSDDLANRMIDPKYKEFSKFFRASEDGNVLAFKRSTWRDELVEKYLTKRFENEAGAGNSAVSTALYFERKAGNVSSFYDILGDKELYSVVRTVAGLPASFSRVDVDRQVAKLKTKFDIEDFKSPAKVAKMIDRYLAMSDVQNNAYGGGSSSALALQTFSGGGLTGFAPLVSFDPSLFT